MVGRVGVVFAILCCACGSAEPLGEDAGEASDAGGWDSGQDAATADAATPDMSADGGPTDLGSDAGPADAGLPDSGEVDAGEECVSVLDPELEAWCDPEPMRCADIGYRWGNDTVGPMACVFDARETTAGVMREACDARFETCVPLGGECLAGANECRPGTVCYQGRCTKPCSFDPLDWTATCNQPELELNCLDVGADGYGVCEVRAAAP